jgi:mono/diheme cytochrome c family protein
MKRNERLLWLALLLLLLGAVLVRRSVPPQSTAAYRSRAQPGLRLSMNELHQQGGVPLGWQLTLPPGDPAAGRQAFVDFGCQSCHRVAGEAFSEAAGDQQGPELSGMGSHHPATYFAEAILNPDAVLIDAPGYVGDDGHSIMPTYPEMTVSQLSDIVAYLGSLKQGGMQSCHVAGSQMMSAAVNMSKLDLQNRPPPQPGAAHVFFAQTYDVLPGQLAAFETWFATQGRQQFLAVDGLVSIETFVDAARPTAAITSLFEFRDEAALRNFMGDPASAQLWNQFDAFVGPHGHFSTDRPLVYRAASLSTK